LDEEYDDMVIDRCFFFCCCGNVAAAMIVWGDAAGVDNIILLSLRLLLVLFVSDELVPAKRLEAKGGSVSVRSTFLPREAP
jgi:hypothetical protein